MSRKLHFLSQRLVVATTLALGASGVALADDSSMSRIGGDSYAYFNSQPVGGNAAAGVAWRQNHPGGLTGRELQALSSSDLSAVVAQVNPQVLAAAPADPAWRQSHPNGFTERELQTLSSSSLALWHGPEMAADQTNVAATHGPELFAARLKNFFKSGGGKQTRTD
jgi:hypothetical protein